VTSEPLYADDRWIVSRHAQVAAVLDDPHFVVPAAEPAESGVGWLRWNVSRFANGTEHAHRRAEVETMLAELDTRALCVDAATQTNAVLDGAAGGTVDVMSTLSRRVPLTVLAQALAIETDADVLVDAITAIAPAYPPGADAERERRADAAVERLRAGATVAQLTALVQMCDATAGLIGNSVHIGLALPEPRPDIDALLAETLRYSPAVRNTRRVASVENRIGETAVAQGSVVLLDFDAANRDPDVFAEPDRFEPGRSALHLTFGHGFRACPGSDHALALAAGVVESVLSRCDAASPELTYEPSPNLRVPAQLAVTVRGYDPQR
jgi:cytochrome P450